MLINYKFRVIVWLNFNSVYSLTQNKTWFMGNRLQYDIYSIIYTFNRGNL